MDKEVMPSRKEEQNRKTSVKLLDIKRTIGIVQTHLREDVLGQSNYLDVNEELNK